MQDLHQTMQIFSQARHPTKTREINGTETPHTEELGLSPDDVSTDALKRWAGGLRPFRTDVEKAVQTMGRVRGIEGVIKGSITIDLRGMNAQGFDLSGLDFSWANLHGVRMEGAFLKAASMEEAELWRTRLDGACLGEAILVGADLSEVSMEGADLVLASMERTYLTNTRMLDAKLGWAKMQRARFTETRLEGADLRWATIERAYLIRARMDASTNLTNAIMRGAFISNVDCSKVPLSQAQIDQMFGDLSVKLPEGITRPQHWSEANLSRAQSYEEWRKWQDNPEGYRPLTLEQVEALRKELWKNIERLAT